MHQKRRGIASSPAPGTTGRRRPQILTEVAVAFCLGRSQCPDRYWKRWSARRDSESPWLLDHLILPIGDFLDLTRRESQVFPGRGHLLNGSLPLTSPSSALSVHERTEEPRQRRWLPRLAPRIERRLMYSFRTFD